MASLKRLLLKIARMVLQQVLDVINKQINRVQQEVLDQLMSQINGLDEIWVGEGADALKAEMSSKVFPTMNRLVGVTTRTHTSIINAAERIEQADRQVRGLVDDLVNDFASIYS